MKKVVMVLFLAGSVFSYGTAGFSKEPAKAKSGEELFQLSHSNENIGREDHISAGHNTFIRSLSVADV